MLNKNLNLLMRLLISLLITAGLSCGQEEYSEEQNQSDMKDHKMKHEALTSSSKMKNDHKHNKIHSDYTSEVNNEIKALTEKEIKQFLNGEGMGLAKAAELNNYPGPKHVLDFSFELNLTQDQKEKTEALFKSMKTEAVRLGNLLIEMEKELDSIFKSKYADEELIRDRVMEISNVKGKIRFVHLDAHLKQKEILTNEQVNAYSKLRGYN